MRDHKYASIKISRILVDKIAEVAVQKNGTYHTASEFVIESTRRQSTNSSKEQLTETRSGCFFIRSSHLFLPYFLHELRLYSGFLCRCLLFFYTHVTSQMIVKDSMFISYIQQKPMKVAIFSSTIIPANILKH
jgi:hypothetical protein